jgi:hypothetical protein
LLFVLAAVDVPVIGDIPVAAIGIVVMAGFAISSAVQFWQHTQQQDELPPELSRHE